ncbi:oxidoreductase [Fusobacterium polymorphum]|uniref:Oxidoreductase n=1 Tax=Fusobacterium nucleatum subsp. polymorphum TaxID=76857 RepID=A0A2B7YGM3_FUSNP|nr:aldo/keto reductase [Fusobacterium polymorphum]PGH20183.1 oxidoreductase [Fusobacterium polymorphum]
MKLCLGTVQFGLNYGIEKKKIETNEINKILITALENEIKILDTAQNYGDSEKLIGNFEKRNYFKIISKVSSDSLNNMNDLRELEILLQNSMNNLKIPSLDGLLLHKGEDLKNKVFLKNLNILKQNGYFQNFGVSIYSPEEAIIALELEDISYIQVPYNILDTRLDKINFFEKAKKNNKTIFVRSIFLQGVLLKENSKYPKFLEPLKAYNQLIENEIKEIGCTKLDFLLNFIKSIKEIDYIIVGIDSLKNLEEIIRAYNYSGLEAYNYNNLRSNFINISEDILNPSLWRGC